MGTEIRDSFYEAIKAGDLEKVASLLDAYPAVIHERSEANQRPVMMAVYYGNKELEKLLLERGAEPVELTPQMEVTEAAREGNIERVSRLLDNDPQLLNALTERGQSPIWLAVCYRHPELRDFLLTRGATIDLVLATAGNDLELVKKIVATDPDQINRLNADGFAPIHHALYYGHKEIAKFLVMNGADLNLVAENEFGVAPLNAAVAGQWFEGVQLMLKYGANVNLRIKKDWTALHQASSRESLEILTLLLESGANVHARTSEGMTPLMVAMDNGRAENAAVLRQYGARE